MATVDKRVGQLVGRAVGLGGKPKHYMQAFTEYASAKIDAIDGVEHLVAESGEVLEGPGVSVVDDAIQQARLKEEQLELLRIGVAAARSWGQLDDGRDDAVEGQQGLVFQMPSEEELKEMLSKMNPETLKKITAPK